MGSEYGSCTCLTWGGWGRRRLRGWDGLAGLPVGDRLPGKLLTISRNETALGEAVSPGSSRPQDVKASKAENKKIKNNTGADTALREEGSSSRLAWFPSKRCEMPPFRLELHWGGCLTLHVWAATAVLIRSVAESKSRDLQPM